jgi:norsolorinic acid ketoreductase
VAAVRKIGSAESLKALPASSTSRLVIIEVDVASADTIRRGIGSLNTEHGIDSLDVVLANAGIAAVSPSLMEAGAGNIQPFIDVNAYGQLNLFKAVAPMLRHSESGTRGKFMYMSSAMGSIGSMYNIASLSAYGASKALGNFIFKWLSAEQQDIIIWAQHPGCVSARTSMVHADIVQYCRNR